jgi:hypothetical protein
VQEDIADIEADDMIRLFSQTDPNCLTKEEFMRIQRIHIDV